MRKALIETSFLCTFIQKHLTAVFFVPIRNTNIGLSASFSLGGGCGKGRKTPLITLQTSDVLYEWLLGYLFVLLKNQNAKV